MARKADVVNTELRERYDAAVRAAIKSDRLHGGGGGGTLGDMDAVDAKIAAAEARTDTKFEKVLGELKLLNQRMEHVENSTSGLRLNTWMAAASAVALVAAIFGWGSSMFGVGMNVESVATKAASSAVQSAQPQIDQLNARYTEMNGKLDQLIHAVGATDSGVENGGAMPAPFPTPND